MDSPNDDQTYERKRRVMADEQYYRQMREAARWLQAGDGQNAAVILERLYDLHPGDVDVAVNLGGAYIMSKRYKQAVTVLESAVGLDSGNAAAWNNLAAAYLGTLAISTPDQQARAIDAFQRTLAIDPTYPSAHYNLGLIYEDQEDWPNARRLFADALRVDPLDRDARLLLDKIDRLLHEQDQTASGLSGFSSN